MITGESIQDQFLKVFNPFIDQWASVNGRIQNDIGSILGDYLTPVSPHPVRSPKIEYPKGRTSNIRSFVIGPKGFGLLPSEENTYYSGLGKQTLYVGEMNYFWFIQKEHAELIPDIRKRSMVYNIIKFREALQSQLIKLNSSIEVIYPKFNAKMIPVYIDKRTSYFTEDIIHQNIIFDEPNIFYQPINSITITTNILPTPSIETYNKDIRLAHNYFHPMISICCWGLKKTNPICLDNCLFTQDISNGKNIVLNTTWKESLTHAKPHCTTFRFPANGKGATQYFIDDEKHPTKWAARLSEYRAPERTESLLVNVDEVYGHPMVQKNVAKIIDFYSIMTKTLNHIKVRYADLKFLSGNF